MKKCPALLLLLFTSALMRSQTAFEIGVQGMQYLTKYDMQHTDNSLNSDGTGCGLRLGAVAGKNVLQASVIYSRVHGPQPVRVNEDNTATTEAPTKIGVGLMLLGRHHFNTQKKVVAFISAGASGFIFNRTMQYQSASGPVLPGQPATNRYNLAAVVVPGLRCKLSGNFLLDLEPALAYSLLNGTYYKNNLSFSIGITLNYLLSRKNPSTANE